MSGETRSFFSARRHSAAILLTPGFFDRQEGTYAVLPDYPATGDRTCTIWLSAVFFEFYL